MQIKTKPNKIFKIIKALTNAPLFLKNLELYELLKMRMIKELSKKQHKIGKSSPVEPLSRVFEVDRPLIRHYSV